MTVEKRKATPHLAFGTALRDAREKSSVRLCELAERLSVSVPFLSDVEKGRRPLSEERIRIAAKFLKTDLISLLEVATKDRGKITLEFDASLNPSVLRAMTRLAMNWPKLPRATVKHLLDTFDSV